MQQPSTHSELPPWRKSLLAGHVVVAVSLIGSDLVLIALGVSGLRGADPQIVYPAAHTVDAWIVAPLAILALATGILQAVVSEWGLVTYWWVTTKLAITAAAAVVVIVVLEPRLAASAGAAMAGESFSAAERLPLVIAPSVAVALLVLNVTLGLFKPGRRRR